MAGYNNLHNTPYVALYPSNTPAADAFGRARVSMPTTLFDSKQLHEGSTRG